MTWSLIKQDNALNNLDMLEKWRVDLTIDNNFFTEIKYSDLFDGKEWVIENDGFYLNIGAGVSQNPFTGSNFSVSSEIQDIFACYITDNYNAARNFEERFEDDFPSKADSGIMFFDGSVENYYIYKHDTLNSFLFVVEWASNQFSFMYFGDFYLATAAGNQTSKCFSTNGEFRTSDTSVSLAVDFRPIFAEDGSFFAYYNNKFIPQESSGFDTGKWSDEWFNLKTNISFDTTTNGLPPTWGSRSNDAADSIFAMSKTKFNDKHIPLPIYIYCRNRNLNGINIETMLGTLPDLNYICFDTINSGEVLTYGTRVAKCFPNHQKTIPSDWNNDVSEVSGIAVRTS